MSNSDSSVDAPDLVWGAGQIGKVIGLPVAATYHKLEQGHLPARKVGAHWVASRKRLLAIADPVEPAA
jgi:hypothetical protein